MLYVCMCIAKIYILLVIVHSYVSILFCVDGFAIALNHITCSVQLHIPIPNPNPNSKH